MRRIALGSALLAAALAAPEARAEHDRTDRIPASVAPDDFRSYYVNAAANLPAGVTPERWLSVAKRTLERYGGTYLGTTSASADNHDDSLDVIGFSAALPPQVAGRNTKSKGGRTNARGSAEVCEPRPDMATTQSVATVQTPVRLRLRADRVRRRKVRRRTVTVTRSIPTPRLDSAPLAGARCTRSTTTSETVPGTVEHESDVQMDTTPEVPWHPGPGLPPEDRLDLETVLIHELGHSAGLAHQPQNCDPSSPMRPSGSNGEYWRGLDEFHYLDCSGGYPVTPDAPHGPEGPFGFGVSLGGRAFHVNPAVPGGYDSARFVELARSIVERWGGTYAGTTASKPTAGDGLNVIGFDEVAQPDYEMTLRMDHERLVFPAFRTCAIVTGPVTGYRVRRVTKKVRIRVRGRRRTLKLRRDRVVRRIVSGPASGQCTDHAARSRDSPDTYEWDVGIAHEMDAYEMGPQHPVLQTRVDMATTLAAALGRVAGAQLGDRCAGETPVTLTVAPGDWWRSPADVKRVGCPGGRALSRAGRASGRVRYVLVQD